jgi:hypothetical protein
MLNRRSEVIMKQYREKFISEKRYVRKLILLDYQAGHAKLMG